MKDAMKKRPPIRKLKTSHAIDIDLVEYLQAVAEREGITRSQVINRLVRDRLEVERKQQRPSLINLAPAATK